MDGARVIALRSEVDEPAAALVSADRKLAIACLLAALWLVVQSSAITNVALPALASGFQVTQAASVRIVTAYQLALMMALLPCAALGESLGYRRVFSAGIALFTAASLLCACAPSLSWLLVARFVQGLGGAAVMALGTALLRFVVPRQRLARAISWNALVVALSSASGPTLGALLISMTSLPWLFAINVPLGVVLLLVTHTLPAVEGSARPLDAISMASSALSFAALIVGTELLPAAPTPGLLVLGLAALMLAVVVRRELPKEAPLLPLDLLRARTFSLSVIASVACFTGQTAALLALPFFLQHELAFDALMSGCIMTFWPLSVALAAPLAGRLAERVSSGWLSTLGAGCQALGLAGVAFSRPLGEALPLVPFMVQCGVGFGLFQVPNNRNMLLSAPHARSAAAGGMQGTARLLGQTLGAVAMTLLFTLTTDAEAPRSALILAAVSSVVAGAVSALRVPSGH